MHVTIISFLLTALAFDDLKVQLIVTRADSNSRQVEVVIWQRTSSAKDQLIFT